ncbi:hypothetical protein [Halorubrum tebenquichense]|uniref:hypothetical protein n=1 Tax=Halorubrum tebenquichense TaxID=119434 RepID=UPI0009E228CD|nr:hypothetical protein [Halorubrum tebenquichense]
MPSLRRRSFLKAVGIAGTGVSVAGCSEIRSTESPEDPPAGSLNFRNDHSVPHEISVEVLDMGTTIGERVDGHDTVTGTPDVVVPQRDLTATAVVEPGEARTYEAVFESQVWYDVRFTLDDEYPGEDSARTVFKPVHPDADITGRTLEGRVSEGGEFSWAVSAIGNP